MLVEEGKVRLDEPVDRLLPELANRKVLKRIDGPIDDTDLARRPITTRDLLTFCLGFGMAMGPVETPIQKAMTETKIMGLNPSPSYTPDEWIKQFATLPLMYQPGERWQYHTGSDILGVLIRRASGMDLEAFFRERIFEPLGMKDTGFSVPEKKLDRLGACYSVNMQTRELDLVDKPGKASNYAKPPLFPAGGGGLVSTADDYLAFARMLLNLGEGPKERILSRPSVETMTTDQLNAQQKELSAFMPGYWDHRGWGFGCYVINGRTSSATTPGNYGWGGAFGTTWNNDPKEEMITILMVQRGGMGPGPAGLGADFPTLAYQAIDD